MNVPWWSKAISGFIGIFLTVAGAMVTVIFWNDNRMDEKDAKVREEVRTELIREMDTRKMVRDIQMTGMEERLTLKLDLTNSKVAELSQGIKELQFLGRDIRKKVTIVEEAPDLYTKTKNENSNVGGSL